MKKKQLSNVQLADFFSGVGMMLRAGGSPSEAAGMLTEGTGGLLAQAGKQIVQRMEEGTDFASAVRETKAFPDYASDLLELSQKTGRLDEGADRLGEFYARKHKMQQKIRTALIYPVVLLMVMGVVLAVMVFAVLPVFCRVYEDMTGSLEGSSYFYVSAASLMGRVSLILTAVVCLAVLVGTLIMRTEKGGAALARWAEKLPLTREASYDQALSTMTLSISSLLASGADSDTALQMTLSSLNQGVLKKKMERCAEAIQSGVGMDEAMERERVYGNLYSRIIRTGFHSGNPVQAMELVAEKTGIDAENRISGLIDMVEPILIAFLTVSVGLTLLSVMLPLIGIMGAL